MEFDFPFPSHSHRISIGIPMGIVGIPEMLCEWDGNKN